jgi:pimeloyl-ACP methyl ester carboxylesterase
MPRALAFDESDCRLEAESIPAVFARCATLTVAENPDDPASRGLDLFFARISAATANPAADPLLLINGGPGGSAVDLYLQNRAAFDGVLRDREILLLDQRGTGRSLAGLTCDVPDELALTTATPEVLRRAVEACIAEFPRDQRLFTTSVAVRDLEALRLELGIAQWNLYGVSYGTRVAQHYLRRYPAATRAVILDGVVPAELVLGPAIAVDAQAAFDQLLERCAASPPCSERFQNLEQRFATLQERFRGDSIELVISDPTTGRPKSFVLDESHLQAVIRLMSYADTTAALIPLVIVEAHDGNYLPLAAMADLLIESVSESIGFAMHNSVVCTEDVPNFPATIDGLDQTYLGSTIVDGLRAICDVWPAGLLDGDFKEPVVSEKPILLLSGENDPITPPAYAERAMTGGLTNAVHVVGPGKGHGLIAVGCTPRIAREFLLDPNPETLDTSCIEGESPLPFFLDFQGPAP